MLLERTLYQIDIGHVPPEQAAALGSLAYRQWLGGLRPRTDYIAEAKRAHRLAFPFAQNSPAVAVFCDLLTASITAPLKPLSLHLPPKGRRGGAKARRLFL